MAPASYYPTTPSQQQLPQAIPPQYIPALWATPKPPTFVLPTLPPMTPKDIPEQLRLLGSNILADLIERADLTEALKVQHTMLQKFLKCEVMAA